jgi:hypothetical protein
MKSWFLRIAERRNDDGGTELLPHHRWQGRSQTVRRSGLEDALDHRARSASPPTARRSTGLDSRGRDTAALVAQDMASGQTRVVAQDPRADIGDASTTRRQAWRPPIRSYLKQRIRGARPSDRADVAF